jgi:hypothetical protein
MTLLTCHVIMHPIRVNIRKNRRYPAATYCLQPIKSSNQPDDSQISWFVEALQFLAEPHEELVACLFF